MKFYFFPFLATSGSLNMSLDKNLFQDSKKNFCSNFRFYIWSPPAVSLGKNQRPDEIVHFEECLRNKIDLVKRPTGGRALLHHKELTYFLSGPLDGKIFPKNFQETYRKISQALLEGLNHLKIPAEINDQKSPYKTSPSNPLPCFSEPAPGEITVEGKKIIGSAMLVEEEFFLIHGSIMIDFDEKLQKLLFKKNEFFNAATLSSYLKPLPHWKNILISFKKGFEDFFKIKFINKPFKRNLLKKSLEESFYYKILKP